MKLIELIRQLKRKNILKKFLVILGITGFVSFLFISIIDKAVKIVTFTPDSKIIEEKEIEFRYRSPAGMTPEIIEQKGVLSLVRKKFWKIFLEANRYGKKEGIFFDFDINMECYPLFLKGTKIYIIILQSTSIIPPPTWRLFVVVRKDSKIFDLEKLCEFNEFIRGEKIWIDTPPKAIKYAILYIKLVLNYGDGDYPIAVVNSLDEFINKFILGKWNNEDYIPGRGTVYYKTLQQYIQYRPKKYQQLLKYKDEIKSPQVIKETNDSYEIIIYAREELDVSNNELVTDQLALIKLKFIVYKNGEIDLKKEHLVRGIRQWIEVVL